MRLFRQIKRVELAEQAYTPQFGVEVMYSTRQAEQHGG